MKVRSAVLKKRLAFEIVVRIDNQAHAVRYANGTVYISLQLADYINAMMTHENIEPPLWMIAAPDVEVSDMLPITIQ